MGFNTVIINNPGNLNPWINCDYGEADKYRKEILKLAEGHGIKVIMGDSWIKEGTHDGYQVKSYGEAKAFAGLALPPIVGKGKGDAWTLAKAGGAVLTVKRKFGNRDYIVELLPSYASEDIVGDYGKGGRKENYKAYLEQVATKMPCNILSWYHAPKTEGSGLKGSLATDIDLINYLENLEWVAEAVEAGEKDLWVYLPATAHDEMKYAPNLTMLKAMMGLSLCYGAKGLVYHSYQQPCAEQKLPNANYYGPYMLMAKVKDRSYWYEMKKINEGLAYLGPHFAKSTRLNTVQHISNVENYKLCLDSCVLIHIPKYDTTYTESFDSISISEIRMEGYDTSYVDSVYRFQVRNENFDSSVQDDSLTQDSLRLKYRYKIISKRMTTLDRSKNVVMNASGDDLKLVSSIFDYGKGSRMLALTNYNYSQKVELNMDFGANYEVLDLQYWDRRFDKCTEKQDFSIEPGESRIFILKPKG